MTTDCPIEHAMLEARVQVVEKIRDQEEQDQTDRQARAIASALVDLFEG